MPSRPANSDPINPYAASRVGDAPVRPREPSTEEPIRHYQARLTWSDREALLRSVGPMRVAAVFSALLFAKAIYGFGAAWYRSAPTLQEMGLAKSLVVSALLCVIAGEVVALCTCWLSWRYADALRELASGRTANAGAVARLHYQTAWLLALAVCLAIGFEVLSWLGWQVVTQSDHWMLDG